jgi:hypothetical protein
MYLLSYTGVLRLLLIVSRRACLLVVVLMAVAWVAQAAPAGRVTFLEGRVDVLVSGEDLAHPASLGGVAAIGDVYRAKSDGRAEISLTSGAVLRIGTNTRVEVKEYSVRDNVSSVVLRLYRGKIQVISASNETNDTPLVPRFEVYTPSSVVQVTGTNLLVAHDRGSSLVFVLSGQGFVRNVHTPQVAVPVGSSSVSLVPTTDAPPTPPVKASDSQISSVLQSFAPRPTGTKTADMTASTNLPSGHIPTLITIGLVPSMQKAASPFLMTEIPRTIMQNPLTTPPPSPQVRPSTPTPIGIGTWSGSIGDLETSTFLQMTTDSLGQQKLAQLNIPAVEVGSVNMTCSNCSASIPRNGFTSFSMTGVKFFAFQSGGTPKIWATAGVSGNYVGTPSASGPVLSLQSISGGQLSTNVTLQQWNTNLNKWIATAQGSGTLTNAASPINLKGAAAGSFGNGQLSGTAAGTAK